MASEAGNSDAIYECIAHCKNGRNNVVVWYLQLITDRDMV